ncbi:GntR family transcriptional regulator [Pseudonocardia sp. C8]|uniref:GntR family transcriptional regulator n=1 Tax=Pseudonocardia sp. C8 TaxID=2762759 RepID=UPI00351BFB85
MTLEPLASLDRTTLRERALDALRTAVVTGRYRPGDHLGEVELASHLGVSRGTVREALRHLQQEGLVTAGARGMLRVNRLSAGEVRDLFRVRAALEGLAVAEIIASDHRASSVAALRGSVAALAGTEHDFAARVEADLGFHLLLCRESGNTMLVDSWRHLEGRIRVTIMNGGPENSPVMMAGDRHAPIVDAIEAGDTASAVAIVESHMASAADHFAGQITG